MDSGLRNIPNVQCAVLRGSAGEENVYRTQLFRLSGFCKTQNLYKTKLCQLFRFLGYLWGRFCFMCRGGRLLLYTEERQSVCPIDTPKVGKSEKFGVIKVLCFAQPGKPEKFGSVSVLPSCTLPHAGLGLETHTHTQAVGWTSPM